MARQLASAHRLYSRILLRYEDALDVAYLHSNSWTWKTGRDGLLRRVGIRRDLVGYMVPGRTEHIYSTELFPYDVYFSKP
jgi:hypothetical protein